ncbi:MAG: tRNA (guanosine(46)-N7)-methyltransferase TrmB [Pseudomonadota bacterium]
MEQRAYIPRLYGRRQAKGLRPRQEVLFRDLLPRLSIHPDGNAPINPAAFFPEPMTEYWFEIGFGAGEHLAWQATRNPNIGFVGAEPFLDGVGKLLAAIDDGNLTNVRVLHGDARPLLEAMLPGSLSRVFLLHPDPWPKKRHHKRRMVSPWFFQSVGRALKPGGLLRVSSDIPDYIRWTLMHSQTCATLDWTATCRKDWEQPPADWPLTRYGAKAIRELRTPTYLQFKRV